MSRHAIRRIGIALIAQSVAIAAVLGPGVPVASASFHLMGVREVYPGSTGSATSENAEYVELQMYASGQNFVAGHVLDTYDAAGVLIKGNTIALNAPSGANQATILLATPEAESQFGVTADGTLSPGLSPVGGAVCWEAFDCVAWGNFSAGQKLTVGSPAAPGGIPDGMALRRKIGAGCATLLEAGDDTNNSAADFEAVFPGPRPNSVPPTEHACGGGPGGGSAAPQTTLRHKPSKRTTDRTPTFRFTSNQSGATFECRLDGKPFRACRSPFTTKKLSFGGHTVKVRAKSPTGQVDGSPASFSFKVLRKPR